MAECPACKADLRTDGVNSWCVQAKCPTTSWEQAAIDDHMLACDDTEDDDDCDIDCGLAPNGQCSLAGSEHCDWECPHRVSEFFAGSAAWNEKQRAKRKSK